MRKSTILVIAVSVLLSTITTKAGAGETDKPVRPAIERIEPEVKKVVDEAGVNWACYGDNQFAQLRHLIADYHTIWALLIIADGQMVDLQNQIKIWSYRHEWLLKDNTAERKRGDQFKALFTSEHKLRLSDASRNNKVRWIPWGLMIAQGVLYAGITVYGLSEN